MRNVGIVGGGDVNLLVTEINTDLIKRPIKPSNVISQLAWMRPGGMVGQRSIFPVKMFGNRSQKRGVYEEIKGTLPETANFSVECDLWAPEAELIPALTRACDLYGVVKDGLTEILAQAEIELERQFAETISNGLTEIVDYDGKTYFATDHECNPNRPGLKAFSNYKAGRALDHDGIVDTFDDHDQMPGPDGNLLSMPGDYIVFVSTKNQEKRAKDLLSARLVTNKAGTATQENTMQGEASVLRVPPLRAYSSGKLWGICKIASAQHRPFVFQQPIPLQAYVEGVAINEHIQATFSVGKQGVKDAHGMGYLWPQLCILCVEP